MEVKYQVFVSSTYEDLKEERQEVINVILELGHIPIGMEYFPASNVDQLTLIKGLLDDCDYYIIIIGGRYGSIDDKTDKSYTQLEFEYAKEKGLPILGFYHKDPQSLEKDKVETDTVILKKLDDFKKMVKQNMCAAWNNSSDLSRKAVSSLFIQFRDSPRQGWIRKPSIPLIDTKVSIDSMNRPIQQSSSKEKTIDVELIFEQALISFAGFIEKYYVIECLYSHSNLNNKLPNSYLIYILNNNIPSHLHQINELWSSAYRAIYQFTAIKESVTDHSSFIHNSINSTIFISYIYYTLSELWGDVPYLKTTSVHENKNLARIPIKSIREDSIKSLLDVLNMARSKKSVNTSFAKVMLVKWYLQEKNYSEARLHLDSLINARIYKLAPLDKIFDTTEESIIGCDRLDNTNLFKSTDFLALCIKGRFVHYIRYTEVLLMAVETYSNLFLFKEAEYYLNLLRKRNNMPEINPIDSQQIIPLLTQEWKKDLSMEGSYFSALKRNGYAHEILNIDANKELLPIPQKELMVNPYITQNKGY